MLTLQQIVYYTTSKNNYNQTVLNLAQVYNGKAKDEMTKLLEEHLAK